MPPGYPTEKTRKRTRGCAETADEASMVPPMIPSDSSLRLLASCDITFGSLPETLPPLRHSYVGTTHQGASGTVNDTAFDRRARPGSSNPTDVNRRAGRFVQAAASAALGLCLTGCGVAGSVAPDLATSAALASPDTAAAKPLVITKGGTYSGTWTSNDPAVPAVQIATREPVVLQNSVLSGRGDLIGLSVYTANVTVRNVTGTGLDPLVAGKQRGAFFRAYSVNSLVVENCTMSGTSFGILVGYAPVTTLKVLNNVASQLEDRTSDGHGGFQTARPVLGHFIQLAKMTAPNGAEIAWNQLKQVIGSGSTEDGINVYSSSGTASTPIVIHDNYLEGNSSAATTRYTGNGIITDGDATGNTGYVLIRNNQVVHTAGGGVAIANGHDVTATGNSVVSCGQDSSGRYYTSGGSAVTLWNFYKNPNFYHNSITGTTGGMVVPNASGKPVISDASGITLDATNTITGNQFTDPCMVAGIVTPAAEDTARTAWTARLKTNGVSVGDQH